MRSVYQSVLQASPSLLRPVRPIISQYTHSMCSEITLLHKYPFLPQQEGAGIATGYGMDGPEFESWWGRGFHTCPDRPLGPASYTMGTGSFPGVKRPGRGVDHPSHLAPRLEKELSYTSTPPLGLCNLF